MCIEPPVDAAVPSSRHPVWTDAAGRARISRAFMRVPKWLLPPSRPRPTRAMAEAIVATVRQPLVVLDQDLRVLSANRAFYDCFRVAPAESEGQRVYALGNGQWDIPDLRDALERVLPEKRAFEGYEVEHAFQHLGRRVMRLNGRVLAREGRRDLILLAIEDVTKTHDVEADLRGAVEFVQKIVDTVREPLLVLESDLRVHSGNEAFYRTFQVTPRETVGRFIYELGDRQWDIPALRRLLEEILPAQKVFND